MVGCRAPRRSTFESVLHTLRQRRRAEEDPGDDPEERGAENLCGCCHAVMLREETPVLTLPAARSEQNSPRIGWNQEKLATASSFQQQTRNPADVTARRLSGGSA